MSGQHLTAFVESPRSATFPCLKMRQPVGDMFVGVIDYRTLRDLTYFDVRQRIDDKSDDDLDRYIGIQRVLSSRRIEDLEKYVRYFDATFPTSVIIAVDAECASYSETMHEMTLSNVIKNNLDDSIIFKRIARVLDGQHRIAGLMSYNGESFDLTVTIFVGVDLPEQAQIFSVVNLEQTKVQRSLGYDLYALARSRSPQRTCHNVVVALDNDPTSPFYHRVKRLGTSTEGRFNETVTQATFVEALLRNVSLDPKGDRDVLLRGRKLPLANAGTLLNVPLRNLFIEEKDLDIAKIIWNYFDAVRRRWPTAWTFGGRGLMLNKTNGFRALMQIFRPAYLYLGQPGQIIGPEAFEGLFNRSKLSDEDFTIERFPPGTGGEAGLRNVLISDIGFPMR